MGEKFGELSTVPDFLSINIDDTQETELPLPNGLLFYMDYPFIIPKLEFEEISYEE